ncbi:HRDC domain-containing protein [Parabacteroides sp. HGS0025]|uniref:HRDC domain-containing protein n=1 Tax=Parabacteroides sp. HGS0025 TaxID=1078087 RepID=UPI00061721C0|nr:HRDC domain-containing protein [Parabacteroides sp. HGS0025]
MQMNEQFDLAFNFLQNTGTHLFLTGKAGTGKTTFLKRLKEVSPKRMIVVAPTGVAAINAGGVTIHSFFQLPFGPYIPSVSAAGNQSNNYSNKFSRDKINIIRSLDLLVIDEVSMVRADLLDAISDVLCRYKDRTKPFGGVQLLLIGDLQQLAPVAKDEDWNLLKDHYASTFFFDSKALSESTYFSIELTHVYRQSDSVFINLLNNIRENCFDDETLQQLNRRYIPDFNPDDKQGYITLTTHNYQAQQINNRKLAELPGKSYRFTAEINNDFPEYSYPTDDNLELKCGAQVMFVKNDSSGDHRYYNGKIGKIVFINPNKITVVGEDGNEIQVEKETWSNVKYTINQETKEITETIAGTFSQYPLKTAWAITIHKSQGLTFEHAIIDASAAFSHGQVYVALSRCKTLEGLVLSSPITRNAMIKDLRIQEFSSSVAEKQPGKEQLEKAQQHYFEELVTELFNFGSIQQRLQYAAYMVYTHLQKLYPELNTQYANTRDAFRSVITEVGGRFQQQLSRMISENPNYLQDEMIQERVRKGVAYFIEHIDSLCSSLEENSAVEIDNKESRKAVNNAIGKFTEELHLKQETLKACKEGFSIARYLSAKSKASIEPPAAAKKRSERSSQPAKATISSDILHPELYNSIKRWRYELATEKELPPYTILQQKALLGIVNTLPTNSRELLAIPGIGKKVIENYGSILLGLVEEYKKQLE